MPRFPRKMALYYLAKLDITNPWTNIWSLRKFDLDFWQTSRQIYMKVQYRDKFFGKFISIPQKNNVVFVDQTWRYKALNQHSSTEKIWFKLLRDLKTLKTSKVGLAFLEKWFCILRTNLALSRLEQIFDDS